MEAGEKREENLRKWRMKAGDVEEGGAYRL